MKRMILLLAAAAALAGCAADKTEHRRLDQSKAVHGFAVENFRCDNGANVTVSPLGEDHVRLFLDHERAELAIGPAASGELYTAHSGLFGKHTEWHRKGGEAVLEYTPGDATVTTVCRIRS